jgi:hypothetical protein
MSVCSWAMGSHCQELLETFRCGISGVMNNELRKMRFATCQFLLVC